MKWATRRNLHIDRTSTAWLIRRFVDPEAEFSFVESGTDPATVEGHTFDMRGGDYTHSDGKCTFEVILDRHGLTKDAALVELGRIIRDGDLPARRTRRPEAAGIDAMLRGLQRTMPDDAEKLRVTGPVYDALYAYCQAKVTLPPAKQGTPQPRLNYHRRVNAH